MWDLPTEGTYRFSGENDTTLAVLDYLGKIDTDELKSEYLKYEAFQKTEYTSSIHSSHSLGYRLVLKFEPSSIRLSITEELHQQIVKMYSIICQELARRLVYESESIERDPV